jgi:hypothetical protein
LVIGFGVVDMSTRIQVELSPFSAA